MEGNVLEFFCKRFVRVVDYNSLRSFFCRNVGKFVEVWDKKAKGIREGNKNNETQTF